MSADPLISVVIPTYNYACYLPRAVATVMAQSYRNFEIIIVDDGSTDDTAAVAASLAACYPGRVSYLHQKNSGPNAARNRGICAAKGDYVALLDSDDEWMPGKLATQVDFARRHPDFGIVGCGFRWIGEGDEVLVEVPGATPPPREDLIRHLKIRYFNLGTASGALIRKECFDTVGAFDENLRGSEDRDMWLRIATRFDVGNVEDILVRIHIHGTNCHKNFGVMLDNRLSFIDKHFRSEPFLFKQRAVSYAFLDAAREALHCSRKWEACLYSLKAIWNFPAKATPEDDKYFVFIKSLLPAWVVSALH